VADYYYLVCGGVKGETKPANVEQEKHTKTDLVAALKDSVAYCDPLYTALTDASLGEMVKGVNGQRTRLGALIFNAVHGNEHYGNIVTYMRLKGMTPPSSQGR
jgi:uncharacterized damage-inducible protein DinB